MNSYHSVVQQCFISDGALSLECTITRPPVQQPHAQFYTVPALPLDSTGCLSLGFLFLITFSKSHYGLFHNAFYSWFQVQTYCYFGGPCYSYLVICLYLMAVAIGTLVWDLTVKTHLMLLNIQMCKSTFQKTYNNRTN